MTPLGETHCMYHIYVPNLQNCCKLQKYRLSSNKASPWFFRVVPPLALSKEKQFNILLCYIAIQPLCKLFLLFEHKYKQPGHGVTLLKITKHTFSKICAKKKLKNVPPSLILSKLQQN